MCGIGGLQVAQHLFDENALEKTRLSLLHRGPDDSGIYEMRSHGIALIHTRLSILDLSEHGHQPLISENGRVVITYNGEIYNFRNLRSYLESHGHDFKSTSDTEVLLKLYLHEKSVGGTLKTLLPRLNGIFAFAIWDADIGSLLLARDTFGVKPLYYSHAKEGLAFASEIKALQNLISRWEDKEYKLDLPSINRYLTYLWCPGDGTPVKNIRKLNPGELLVVQDGRIVAREKWYSLPVSQVVQTKSTKNFRLSDATILDTISVTEELLRQAVSRQMVSDVPLGAFLSGGLDSSAIVAFARESNPNISCFTMSMPEAGAEGFIDDLPFARRVASYLDVPLEIVETNPKQVIEDLPLLVSVLEEPLADPAALSVLYICRNARARGIKVLLSGVGGDDLFTGYRRHLAVIEDQLWSWLPVKLKHKIDALSTTLDQRRPIFRRLRKYFEGASLTADERIMNYFRWTTQRNVDVLLTPNFREAVRDHRAEEVFAAFLRELPNDLDSIERMLGLEQRFFLSDHNLIYTDKMSMAVGVEVRVPFLDSDLVNHSAKISSSIKIRGRTTKWILKKAMEKHLPKDIVHRKKTGFGVPLRRWLNHEMHDYVLEVLNDGDLKKKGYLRSRGSAFTN